MASHKAGSRSPARAVDLVGHLIVANPSWTQTQVYREVHRRLAGTEDEVSESTVGRLYHELRRLDTSDPWSPISGDPDDVALVLELVPAVSEYRGEPWWPSDAAARWIARIRRAYPDCSDLGLIHYLAAVAIGGEDRARLVGEVLAYRPWADDGRAVIAAVAAGHARHEVAALAGYGIEASVAYQTARHPKLGQTKGGKK